MALTLIQSTAYMAFASYGASGVFGTSASLTERLTIYLNGEPASGGNSYAGFFPTYNDPANSEQLTGGDWKVVWGPCVIIPPEKSDPSPQDMSLPHVAANSMYVAHSDSQNAFVVAIAGTDYTSFYDWSVEDLEVDAPLVPWPIGSQDPVAAGISRATATGIANLRSMTAPSAPVNGARQETTLEAFLNAVPAATRSVSSLTFTGHSLAGALAPTLAYALYPDPASGWSEVRYLGLAGPTAGNQAFASGSNTAYQPVASDDELRPYWNVDYHNDGDMVPRAWNDLLSLMPTINEGGGVGGSICWNTIWGLVDTTLTGRIIGFVAAGMGLVEGLGYTPINMMSFTPSGDASAPRSVASGVAGDFVPDAPVITSCLALGKLIDAAHHTAYYDFFGLTPIAPMDSADVELRAHAERQFAKRRVWNAVGQLASAQYDSRATRRAEALRLS